MKVAVAGFMHESNSFCPVPTTSASFHEASFLHGEKLIATWKDAHHEIGGFLAEAENLQMDVVPILVAWATPAGPVEDELLDSVTGQMIRTIHEDDTIDGLLLALHGAMVCPGYPDADGEILDRLRSNLGKDFPIVLTLDFHANVSDKMISCSNATIIYQTNPHLDQRKCGVRAAQLIRDVISGSIKPTQALAKPRNLISISCQNTSLEPLCKLMDQTRQLEENDQVIAASLSAGFPYADVPEMGPSVVVVTNDNPPLAKSLAESLAHEIWQNRDVLYRRLTSPREAVAAAIQSDKQPVVLVEFGDNVGGGSPGDSTVIFSELLDQSASNSLVVIYDPKVVAEAQSLGIGGSLECEVGGKLDQCQQPVRIKGKVQSVHDGTWIETEARHGGRRHNDQGSTVVIEVELKDNAPMTLVVNSKRTPPFSLGQITSLGLEPRSFKILVVKAAIAYRAAYGPVAGEIIEVDTPGITANDVRDFGFQRIHRPLYPLDPAAAENPVDSYSD